MDSTVEIDRKLLDYLVGLDSNLNELVEGGDLSEPKVREQEKEGGRKKHYITKQNKTNNKNIKFIVISLGCFGSGGTPRRAEAAHPFYTI